VHSLLVPAQVACQTAKERGRGRCELYQSSDVSIVRRIDELNLVGSIRNAIEGGKLVLYAQPIVKINGESRFKHYELLVRMLDANGVSMEPSDFLGTAERYQLMQELDRWVVSRAIETLVEMRDDVGGQPLSFSVNLSGQSLGNDQFLDFVRGAISRSGVTPDRLCFEITETVAVENLQKAQLFMEELKKMGCQFSLDDFGTGLSSFAYLKMFKVDVIKIDGRFIEDVIESEVSRSMVTAITEIARVMEVETVAEYVSSEAVLEAVRDLGVDWAQGYFVGEPIRMRDIVEDDTVMLKDATNLLEFESAVHTKESS
jgi:Amt family ammonium transporter